MARINQGAFYNIKKEVENLKKDYKTLMTMYFPNGEWNCNYDFVTDFAYMADGIYQSAITIENKIGTMIAIIKFEDPEMVDKYTQFICQSKDVEVNICNIFNDTLDKIDYSGGFSDIDKETLDKLKIYHR